MIVVRSIESYLLKTRDNIGYMFSLVIPSILLIMLTFLQLPEREEMVVIVGNVTSLEPYYEKNVFKGYMLTVETQEDVLDLLVLRDLKLKKSLLMDLMDVKGVKISYSEGFSKSDRNVIWELTSKQSNIIEYSAVKKIYENFNLILLYAAIFVFVFSFGIGYLIDKGYIKLNKN